MTDVSAAEQKLTPLPRYGIELRWLAECDLERVRLWRNEPRIASMMVDQQYISPEQHQAWFTRISASPRHFCFVAYFRGEPIGVATLTLDPYDATVGEPGIYIGDERFARNLVPFCVVFALLDFGFEQLGLVKMKARVFALNSAARRFNACCGYQPVGQEGDGLNSYQLTAADYYAARNHYSRFIRY